MSTEFQATNERDILFAEIQAAWPSLSEDEVLTLALRALHTLSRNTSDKASIPNFTLRELQDEVWKTLPEFRGCEVSNLGRIRGGIQGAGNLRKFSRQTGGYAVVRLTGIHGPVQVQVSRIVAAAFIREPRGGEVLNHINGNKLDNSVRNLEWLSQKENIRHSNDSGLRKRASSKLFSLTQAERREIQSFHPRIKKGQLASIYGIKSSEVTSIVQSAQ